MERMELLKQGKKATNKDYEFEEVTNMEVFEYKEEKDALREFIKNDEYFNKCVIVKCYGALIIKKKFREDLFEILTRISDKHIEKKRLEITSMSNNDFIESMFNEFRKDGYSTAGINLLWIRKTMRKLKSTKGFGLNEMCNLLWLLKYSADIYNLDIEFRL